MGAARFTFTGLCLTLLACGDATSAPDAGTRDGMPLPGFDAGAGAADARVDASGDFQPEPIPAIDPEPPPACPDDTPDGYYQFLDDTCGAKRHPSDVDRERPCPVIDESAVVVRADGTEVVYRPSTAPIEVDTTSLAGIVPEALQVTVILIRRVDGVPHYLYLSGGAHEAAYQPWSTTKFLAVANAAAALRIASGYQVGLTASVGAHALGDLVTSIHNYDNQPFASNALGRYFHNIGGRARANALIHEAWLGRPATETFGGNYGQIEPQSLGYTFTEAGGASVTIAPDTTSGPANHLSGLTIAEALRRIVLHREEPDQRLSGLQWLDVSILLHGAESSSKGPFGGMSADTAIYLQSGHDIDYIERRSRGQWRIYSKLGLGTAGQFLDVGYACLPVLDDAGTPVPGWGREFIIAAHLDSGGADYTERDRILARAYRAIITRIVDGRL